MPAILRLPDVRPLRPYIILPRPNVIDKWLFENHVDTVLNVFADSYHASLTGDVPSDHVSCTLQLSTILKSSTTFITVHTYRLMLYANVPEASGVDVAHLSSPVVTLGRYDGQFTDSNAPGWTRLTPGVTIELRQPSTAIAEVFEEIAWWPENTYIPGLHTSMLQWSAIISAVKPRIQPPLLLSSDDETIETQPVGGDRKAPVAWISVSDSD